MNKNKAKLLYVLGCALFTVGCSKVVEKQTVQKTENELEAEKIKKEEAKKEQIVQESINKYEEGVKPLYINDILVVNKQFKIPSNFATKLDDEVEYQFELMREDAKKDGLDINIRSGFRSNEVQSMLYNSYVARDGVEKANRYSAKPGHSEHETGLAIDISNGDYNKSIGDWFTETPQAKWLYENAYKYGFILRYPKGKEEITGYKYESWHYRYVGTEHSQYFNQNDLTLEEYLGLASNN